MDSKVLVIGGLLGLLVLVSRKKAPITTPKPPTTTPADEEPGGSPAVENPALGVIPPWTNNPTPGEIELQLQLAAATAAGENLAPILEGVYGPAWDLMVITQNEWNAKLAAGIPESTLTLYYTTSEAGRTAAIREYWIANHPGEMVPDVLKGNQSAGPAGLSGDQAALLAAAAKTAEMLTAAGQNPYADLPPPPSMAPIESAPAADGNTYDVNPYSPGYGQVITPKAVENISPGTFYFPPSQVPVSQSPAPVLIDELPPIVITHPIEVVQPAPAQEPATPAFGTAEYTDWYYGPGGPGYVAPAPIVEVQPTPTPAPAPVPAPAQNYYPEPVYTPVVTQPVNGVTYDINPYSPTYGQPTDPYAYGAVQVAPAPVYDYPVYVPIDYGPGMSWDWNYSSLY